LSAKETFLRLLTIENLDKVLPAELERLNQLRTTTQARYRFLVQRRTMLFHALNTASVGPKKGEEDELLVSKLTAQLVETITDCDQRLEELFRINDQIAQINKLLEVHSSSALAIALRKVNNKSSFIETRA
jgi:3-methyladenine DNA glycosylase/8-oxoguanine DNA glycosylase